MNTEGEKIQWHPAFDAALQIELGEEAKYLTFEPEHLLSKKPMQIDVLVKNEKKVKIRKNIGRIFRQHNIIEYKSPEDHLNIDDFYKVYGYTCIYKTEVEKVNQIPAEELTITFVCYHYPRQMLRNLQNERNMNVKNIENGIYYLYGDGIPIQLIIVPELSIENNYWLNKLRNNLKSGGEIKLFMEQYEKNRDSKLFQALADTVMRANWKEVEEEGNMSDVIKEIFADQFHKCEAEARAQGEAEGRAKGEAEGRAEGAASKMIEQIMKKYKKGCSVAETADMLEENPSVIEQIYDILDEAKNENTASDKVQASDVESEPTSTVIISSPMTGIAADLSTAPDEAFASKMMGDGAVVTPEEGVVVAPEDGTVLFVFDTKHALGFTTDSGIGMIIHVGIDTVKLEGKGFDVQVEAGQHVNKGDVLMKLDLDYLKANAPSVTTPVICTELKDNQKIRLITDGAIKAGEPLYAVDTYGK